MADTSIPIVIIGAGASGLLAAIAAARVRPHGVYLLEKETRVGRKLMATGNGRCNLMNARPEPRHYHGSGAPVAEGFLRELPPASLRKFFDSIGLTCREEEGGRVYPFSGQAGAVVDALRFACDALGVQTLTEARVTALRQGGEGFQVSLANGQTLACRRVIVAGGGKASAALGSDGSALELLRGLGHPVTPLYPALAPLKVPPASVRGLKGVRVQAELRLLAEKEVLRTERGEALFGDGGVSGVAAMQLARDTNEALARGREVSLVLSLMDAAAAREEITRRAGLFPGAPMERLFTGLLHKQIALCLLREAGISPQAAISWEAAAPLIPLLSGWRLPLLGTLPFAQAQVTAGGASLSAFDPDTLASRRVPGLYACGEVLDVDGDCGGFNLLWAWVSGMRVGRLAALSL